MQNVQVKITHESYDLDYCAEITNYGPTRASDFLLLW